MTGIGAEQASAASATVTDQKIVTYTRVWSDLVGYHTNAVATYTYKTITYNYSYELMYTTKSTERESGTTDEAINTWKEIETYHYFTF